MKINNKYFELLQGPTFAAIQKKPFTNRTSYWISRWFDKCEVESRAYQKEKQKLIEKYAGRYDEDGREEKSGKAIKEWKRGDIIRNGDQIVISDIGSYLHELDGLQEIEIDIAGMTPVLFDFENEPKLTPEEMRIIVPIIKTGD